MIIDFPRRICNLEKIFMMEKVESEISDVALAKLGIGMLKKMYADYMNVIGDVHDKIKYYDEY